MSTNYPASKQTFSDPSSGDYLNSPSHSTLHANKNDTLEVLQDTVGYTGSFNFLASGVLGIGIKLGNPTDASWSSGISGFTGETKITDAIDTLDETLSYLAPADASALTGALTMSGTTKYTGYLSSGSTGYKTGEGAGVSVGYIITDATFTLTTPSTSTIFNKADEGYTKWYIATGTGAYSSESDSVDHASNFVEGSRGGTQGTTPWTDGQLSVTAVAWYNSFPKWQKGNAVLTITAAQLTQGYNKMKITREGSFTTQLTSDYEVFYDNSSAGNVVATVTSVDIGTTANTRQISGVYFYTTGTTFKVDGTITNIVKNCYNTNIAAITAASGSFISSTSVAWNDATVTGLSNPPAITDTTATITDKVVTTLSNVRNTAATFTLTPSHPWRSATADTSTTAEHQSTAIFMIDSITATSTATAEYFDDEAYRMNTSIDITTTSYGSNPYPWDSTLSLVGADANHNTGLQTFNGSLKYPATNYSSGYLPTTSQPNYSGAAGSRTWLRYFTVGSGKQSFTITISSSGTGSFQAASSGPSGSIMNLEMLAPNTTQNGSATIEWKDCYTSYTDNNSIGCYASGTRDDNTSTWVVTLGSRSTSTSGGVVVFRLTAGSGWSGTINTFSIVAA